MRRSGRGEVKRVGELFEKYRRTLIAPQRTVVTTFVEVVSEVLGVTVSEKIIRYTPGSRTLYLQSGGPLKSEILMHRGEILAHMKGRLGEKNAPETIL